MKSRITSNSSYKFQYQGHEVALIGADNYSMHRASGEMEERSYNFWARKVKVATGIISSDKRKSSWRTFDIGELKTLKSFTEPFTYEVEKDFCL